MKNKFSTIFTLVVMSISLNAQIGIKTATPQNTLHVNGSLQVVKDLNVGGDSMTSGNSGNKGEFLMSNGTGNTPVWKTIESENFLKVIYVGNKTDISPVSGSYTGSHNNSGNYFKPYIFNVTNKIDNSYLTYSQATGVFTVARAGFYNIVAFITYNLSLNPNGQTAGTAHTDIQKVSPTDTSLGSASTGHGERTTRVYHNLSSINFFNAGETFRVQCLYTQNFRLSNGNVYISYLTP